MFSLVSNRTGSSSISGSVQCSPAQWYHWAKLALLVVLPSWIELGRSMKLLWDIKKPITSPGQVSLEIILQELKLMAKFYLNGKVSQSPKIQHSHISIFPSSFP
jgi:hypothetical protein